MKITLKTGEYKRIIKVKTAALLFHLGISVNIALVALNYFDVVDVQLETLSTLRSFIILCAVFALLNKGVVKTEKVRTEED